MTDAARFLLVGCGHWGNPGADLRSPEFDDMLAPDRQAQITKCLDLLVKFRPTRVALEIEPEQMVEWVDEYRTWRDGEFSLSANEIHQLGFRLAGMMGHETIYGIDWHDHTREIGWHRAIERALALGQRHFVTAVVEAQEQPEETRSRDAARVRAQSVIEQLRESNDPRTLAGNHRAYMDMARIGDGPDYTGADVIMRWYERNMKMFVNLSRLADSPDDRVLLVVGWGPVPLLTHYLQGAGFRVESVLDYLVE